MRKILSYLKFYVAESILGPLFKLLEACFDLIVPYVIAEIIDRGIPQQNASVIIRMGLILVGLGVVGLASSVTAQYFAAKAAVGLATRIRHALFAHIQTLGYPELDHIGTSTLITRMTSDINQVQTGVNLGLRLLLRSPFIVFGAMVMAYTIDAKCALWFAIAIPILALIVFGIMGITMPRYKKTQEKLDQVMLLTRENLAGTRVLRALGQEENEIRDFEKQHEALTSLQTGAGRISALTNPLTYIAINLCTVLLIRAGAIQVNAGTLTQGQVVALVNYMGQILVELVKLANMIVTISKSTASGRRIQAILDISPSMAKSAVSHAPKDTGKGSVLFRNVSFRYAGAASDALSGISFSAGPGEMIGIIGGTGSGKTTLINLIPRFYDITSGVIEVDGMDVREQDPAALRKRIGVVPQKALLFHGTIRENLLWGNPQADDSTLLDALKSAQALDILEAKGGLDAMIEQNGRNLSGGQRQRLTIARALVRNPEILILDDSASALDFATDSQLRSAIRALPYHPTIFIVSQRTSSVRFADQILVLDDGRICGQGTHEELLSGCPVYHEIYATQFSEEARS